MDKTKQSNTYETGQDRLEEQHFASWLKSQGYDVSLMKQYYPYDIYAKKQGKQYLIEFKKRNYPAGKFMPMISVRKYGECLSYAKSIGATFVYANAFQDKLVSYILDDDSDKYFGLFSRKDRPELNEGYFFIKSSCNLHTF